MDFVGFAYLRGAVVKRNPAIAIAYFKDAADESAQAAFNLGQCYFGAQAPAALGATAPNVLFIAADDHNDWIGCMSGYPQRKTLRFDRLTDLLTEDQKATITRPFRPPCSA